MSEVIHEIAAEMSPLILAAEEAMEDAMVAVANLMAGTVAKRREVGLLPIENQPTVLLLHRALTQTIESSGRVLRAHGKIEKQYQALASGDTHPLTRENVEKGAAAAARRRAPALALVG